MIKNKFSICCLVASVLIAILTLLSQNTLDVFTFLLSFYLVPMLFFSIGLGVFKTDRLNVIGKAAMGAVGFTFAYALVFWAKIIDFQGLISRSHLESIHIGTINLDLSSLVNTFMTVFAMIIAVNIVSKGVSYIKNLRKQEDIRHA